MYGWTEGWIDGWKDGRRMDGWMDGCVKYNWPDVVLLIEVWMEQLFDEQVSGFRHLGWRVQRLGWMDGWTDGGRDGWIGWVTGEVARLNEINDGCADGQTE